MIKSYIDANTIQRIERNNKANIPSNPDFWRNTIQRIESLILHYKMCREYYKRIQYKELKDY